MSTHYVIDDTGKPVSVILPIAEYQRLLEYAAGTGDETAYLLCDPENARILRACLQDLRAGRNVQVRELLPDED